MLRTLDTESKAFLLLSPSKNSLFVLFGRREESEAYTCELTKVWQLILNINSQEYKKVTYRLNILPNINSHNTNISYVQDEQIFRNII